MRGTPSQPDPRRPGTAIPVRVTFDEKEGEAPERSEDKEVHRRRFRVTAQMLIDYGYTEGCEGCRLRKAGMEERRGHTEECRRRIEKEMEKTEDGRRRKKNEQERLGEEEVRRRAEGEPGE